MQIVWVYEIEIHHKSVGVIVVPLLMPHPHAHTDACICTFPSQSSRTHARNNGEDDRSPGSSSEFFIFSFYGSNDDYGTITTISIATAATPSPSVSGCIGPQSQHWRLRCVDDRGSHHQPPTLTRYPSPSFYFRSSYHQPLNYIPSPSVATALSAFPTSLPTTTIIPSSYVHDSGHQCNTVFLEQDPDIPGVGGLHVGWQGLSFFSHFPMTASNNIWHANSFDIFQACYVHKYIDHHAFEIAF